MHGNLVAKHDSRLRHTGFAQTAISSHDMSPVVTLPACADTSKDSTSGQLDEATALARLLEVSTVVLRQAVDLVNDNLTSDDQLTVHSQYLPGSTIGTHCISVSDSSLSPSTPPRETPPTRTGPFYAANGVPIIRVVAPRSQLRCQVS